MEPLKFANRQEFRNWLSENALSNVGIWLLMSKSKAEPTITAAEALEEALCFGWIDGQMKSVDENSYIKYFKQRSEKSIWSEKNKALTEKLEEKGIMTDFGRAKIIAAKENGQWTAVKAGPLAEEALQIFGELVRPYPQAYENFTKMPPSMQKVYALSYDMTKTEVGKIKRLHTIIERLQLNLNPMERMPK